MKTYVKGNLFRVSFDANEVTNNRVSITLPDGYSLERILVTENNNINWLNDMVSTVRNQIYTFPAVDGKSPCRLDLYINELNKSAIFGIVIEKFGKIPDIHYFDKAFEPILVTDDDGSEYKMIPSEQFK